MRVLKDSEELLVEEVLDFITTPMNESDYGIVIAPEGTNFNLIALDSAENLPDRTLILSNSHKSLVELYLLSKKLGIKTKVFSPTTGRNETFKITLSVVDYCLDNEEILKGFNNVILIYCETDEEKYQEFFDKAEIRKAVDITSTPFRYKFNSFGSRLVFAHAHVGRLFHRVTHVQNPTDDTWDLRYEYGGEDIPREKSLKQDYSDKIVKDYLKNTKQEAESLEREGAKVYYDYDEIVLHSSPMTVLAAPTRDFLKYYKVVANAPRGSLIKDLAGNYKRFGNIKNFRIFDDEVLGMVATIEGKLLSEVSYMTDYFLQPWEKYKVDTLNVENAVNRWTQIDGKIWFGKYKDKRRIEDLPYSYKRYLHSVIEESPNGRRMQKLKRYLDKYFNGR